LSKEEKQDEAKRDGYDAALKRHVVHYLGPQRHLPAREEVVAAGSSLLDYESAIDQIIDLLSCKAAITEAEITSLDKYIRFTDRRDTILSLFLLFSAIYQQTLNELSLLAETCPQGYIYTNNPPSIFAQQLPSPKLVVYLQILALKAIAAMKPDTLKNMKAYAFANYADPDAVGYIANALALHPHIVVVASQALHNPTRHHFDIPAFAVRYAPDRAAEFEQAVIVIHNNSDAFGQNIESEWASGSLDGAVGANGSAAASLMRDREDLLEHVLVVDGLK
jgi:hypothetical protein